MENKDVKTTVAENISSLRTASGITQAELAERINYSDKSVSKWERAESLPDIIVLKQLADMFGVTLDYLVTDHSSDEKMPDEGLKKKAESRRKEIYITLASVALVWIVATVAAAIVWIFNGKPFALALPYIFAVPVSFIVALVFDSVWGRRGRRKHTFLFVTLLLWSVIASVYVSLLPLRNFWYLFIVGIPVEAAFFFLFGIRRVSSDGGRKKAKKSKNKQAGADAPETPAAENATASGKENSKND